jgi:hypothetical protein
MPADTLSVATAAARHGHTLAMELLVLQMTAIKQ